MKLLILVSISVVLFSAESVSAIERTQMCFHRDEDNGAMNIFGSQVVLTNASRPAARRYVWLIGGETKCVSVEPGRWSVQVRSTKPYDPSARNVNQCQSNAFMVVARTRRKLSFYVAPRSRGPVYVCGWKLRRVVP